MLVTEGWLVDPSLHPLFRPIQMNGSDRNTYYIEQIPSVSLMAHVACYWESGSIPHEGERDQERISVPARVLPDG
ncbi:hypothetical protein [Paenibacillus taichungensis]|uniref:hypothetical protein n=1 Tax=Paenibacillus taichungensis TaxID=484184 RepID=UPI0031B60896